MTRLRWLPWALLAPAFAWACSDGSVTTAEDDDLTPSGGMGGNGGSGGSAAGAAGAPGSGGSAGSGGSGGTGGAAAAGLGVGEDCSDRACRAGLVCEDDVCELSGASEAGDACIASGECENGLVCVGQVCVSAGDGRLGDSCATDQSCQSGLRCALVGFGAQCGQEGSGDLGAACTNSSACLGGLACIAGECNPAPADLPPFGAPSFAGVECDDPSSANVRAYFEVPGAEEAVEGDFFRLPFPNDVYLVDGSPKLDDFPTPGSELLGVDPVRIYLDRIEAQHNGWGTEPKVIFRFSGPIDHTTFTSDEAKQEGRVRFVDVTMGISEAERDPDAGWSVYYTTGRSNYVCHNWFGVSRPLGAPLRAGHTYAVILTTGGRDSDGNVIRRSDNLTALLGASEPSDPVLAEAHAAYLPLRNYLQSDNGNSSGRLNIDGSQVLNASVITVHDHQATMRELAEAVLGEETPVASDWVLCDEGVESPCPDAEGDRACGAGTADYDEYHALVGLPVFQQGDAPYLSEGGAIDTSGAVETEQVCLSLTVPTSAAPAAGWPLVIFAHGTGGSFRSHVRDEVAGSLARAEEPFAVLGIDQVQHGPRRAGSDESPENLFFNFLNPDAALGNPLQGAADQLSLLRWAQTLALTADETGGDAIGIDATKLVFFGHSQGSTHGSLMLPFAAVPGAVLSGNGAGLRYSLLAKTQPVNIAQALPFVLADATATGALNMGEWHPALGMLQQWLDAGDPYNFAELAGMRPESGQSPHHIFQTYGIDDSYSPPETLFAYALAARADNAPLPDGVEPDTANQNSRLSPEADPVSGNRSVGGMDITLAMRQYEAPAGSDGHFVVFDVAEANGDAVQFLEALAAGEIPSVGNP